MNIGLTEPKPEVNEIVDEFENDDTQKLQKTEEFLENTALYLDVQEENVENVNLTE